MNRRAEAGDPRLEAAQCAGLRPAAIVHSNPWFAVWDRGGRFTVEYHRPQVAVLPVVPGTGVVMVRPKRPVLDDCPLEFPAGGIEEGESPAAAAVRELREETGIGPIDPARLRPLPPIATAPNREPRLHRLFRVDVSPQEYDARGESDGEIAEVLLLPIAEVARLVATGGIYVTLPLSMLLHVVLDAGLEGGGGRGW